MATPPSRHGAPHSLLCELDQARGADYSGEYPLTTDPRTGWPQTPERKVRACDRTSPSPGRLAHCSSCGTAAGWAAAGPGGCVSVFAVTGGVGRRASPGSTTKR
jgi:hypothetical protein